MFDFSSFRNANISRNTELLLATDIHKLPSAPSPSTSSLNPAPRRQKLPLVDRKSTTLSPAASVEIDDARDKAGLRSSSRVRNQGLDALRKQAEDAKLKRLGDSDAEDGFYWENGRKVKTETGYAPEKLGKRLYNPKRFGHIPGVAVGTKFNFRMDASQAAIHAPVVAGVSGSPEAGAWSIAVSGGYVDDVDLGYRLTYSGSGGRDLKGTATAPKNLRTAPQSADQTWDGLNASLKRSVETKKPIRVLRGFKGRSAFAPVEGYRYDGLYVATKAWRDVGESGFKVCRIALVRLPGQPRIPIQDDREGEVENLQELETAAAIVDVTESGEIAGAESNDDDDRDEEEVAAPEQDSLAPTPPEQVAPEVATKRKTDDGVEIDGAKAKRRRSLRNV
ncbi:hypothetical protein JCM3766R1_006927 [Sporobolomyces carnicolor]